MTYRFNFATNPEANLTTRRAQINNSTESASEPQIVAWYTAIKNAMLDISRRDQGGYLYELDRVKREYWTACNDSVTLSRQRGQYYPVWAPQVFNAYQNQALNNVAASIATGANLVAPLIHPPNPGLDDIAYNTLITAIDVPYNVLLAAGAVPAGPWAPVALPAIVVPVPQALPLPQLPNGVGQTHFMQTLRPIRTVYDQLVQAAVIPANDFIDEPPPTRIDPMHEDEFQDLKTNLLIAYCHSGCTGLGDYEQEFYFTVGYLPGEPYQHIMTVDTVNALLPHNVTPRRICFPHATAIARYQQQNNIKCRWALNHGCPPALAWLVIPVWQNVKLTQMNNQEVINLCEQVSAIARSEAQVLGARDPAAPRDLRRPQISRDLHIRRENVRDLHSRPGHRDFQRYYQTGRLSPPPGNYNYDSDPGSDGSITSTSTQPRRRQRRHSRRY
jgi:hypothetical protein